MHLFGLILINSDWQDSFGLKNFFGLERTETVWFGYKFRNDSENFGLVRNEYQSETFGREAYRHTDRKLNFIFVRYNHKSFNLQSWVLTSRDGLRRAFCFPYQGKLRPWLIHRSFIHSPERFKRWWRRKAVLLNKLSVPHPHRESRPLTPRERPKCVEVTKKVP